MIERKVYIDPLSIEFTVKGSQWTTTLAKSQTNVTDYNQLQLITASHAHAHPLQVEEQEDVYAFSFTIPERAKEWKEMKELPRNDKLRALSNISTILPLATTRITYMIHPNNLTFDENLIPSIIYRGARDLIPPYTIDEADLLKQYKCYCIAMFSEKYTFDDLYTGSLKDALDHRFARDVYEAASAGDLTELLKEKFIDEQNKTEEQKAFVSKRRFRLYKQMAIWMTSVTVLVLGLLFYIVFAITNFQDKQLSAHKDFLAEDYGEVIRTLKDEKVKKLPHQAAYILAYSYVTVERLSDPEKNAIMKNISLSSNENYLYYWIYNGKGDFEESIDTAKYIDDPQLVIYGLIKKLEEVQNDPQLTGAERDEQAKEIRDELNRYTEEYNLLEEEEEEATDETSGEQPIEQPNQGEEELKDEDEEEEEEKEEKEKREKND